MIARRLPSPLKSVIRRMVMSFPLLRRRILPSTDYSVLSGAAQAVALQASSDGWHSARTVARQERAYDGLLADMRRGDPRLDLRVAAEAIAATGLDAPTTFEVGCGSGYYAEVLTALAPRGIRYTGIDYSEAMVARARARYPGFDYQVGDATALRFGDAAFDIVFNGVSLMHILDYRAAIREAARVARHFCIFHSLPVFVDRHPTTYLQKYAYGAPVVEVVFDQTEFLQLCGEAGLVLRQQWDCLPYDLAEQIGARTTARTLLFSVRDGERTTVDT